MIAGGNLGLHNRKNRTGNGKYKELFLFLKVFKKSQLFKAKVIAIYFGVYSTDRNKMQKNNSTKSEKKYTVMFCLLYMKQYGIR